jgi:DNA-binding GntR family transcriptional regulator
MTERPLDRTSPIPLYFQIAEQLKAAIEDGTLKPGDRLDNELDLTERLGVSRPTVRQAVQRLVEQGLVVRRRGLGTVVVAPRILRSVALSSLYDDLSAHHRHPATTVLSATQIEAGAELAAVLALPAGAPVLEVERLRLADGTPLALMHNYLPAGLLNGRPADELEKTGLYELLRGQGVQLHAGEQVIGARRATATEARLLQAARTATVLTMTRTTFDRDGKPVEHGSHAYLADRYSFTMTLVAHLQVSRTYRCRALTGTAAYRYGRCRSLAVSYAARASRVVCSAATSATGTSHHASLGGASSSGSVSMHTIVVRSAARALPSASRNSSMVFARSTSTPRLAALAARSTGRNWPSSRPSGPRYR